jgi:elongation factor 1-alpha
MTGKSDKDHRAWLYLNVLPHEIERGLSADLHYVACGFKAGKPLYYKNPLDKREKARIVREAEKLVSFVDTVGHEPWLRSTIRGIVGQELDYGLLVVAADDGVTHITKEHLGLLLAMDLPVMVCITKTDRVIASKLERVCQQVDELLKSVGKVPYRLRSEEDLNVVIDKLNVVTPILLTSAVTRDGYELLEKLLLALPTRRKEVEKPFILYIDRIYQVPGVGVVVSGTVKQGRLKAGTELLLGPDASGDFKLVRARSIETHYHRLAEANAGLVVGIALKRVRAEELSRGMILCETSLDPRAVWSFDAEVLVLYHPTRIADGYEPVCHISTIAQSVKFELLDKKYLRAGETGRIRMTFKFNPAFVRVGDKLVFREGKTKGIGTVTSIARYA